VVDRLRLFLNRPLRDAERPALFAVSIAVLAAAAAILALLDDAAPAPRQPAAAAPATVPLVPAEPGDAAASPAATPEAPSEEGRPPANLQATRADVGRVKRVARRFLTRYLPYTYGRGSARRIRGCMPVLRRRLARERPRVPRAVRRRRPRLELLQSNGVSPQRAQLVALVRDGKRRYTIPLRLARAASGWTVTHVGS